MKLIKYVETFLEKTFELINRNKKSYSFALVVLYAIIQAWICTELNKNNIPPPVHDGAQYVTAAYNMAKYNVSSVSLLDSANVAPDLVREPVTSFLISLPMRLMKLDSYSLECFLSQGHTCQEQLRWLSVVNTIQIVLITIGVFVAVFELTSSYLLSHVAALLISTSVLLASFAKVFTSEIPAANFFLWHSILLWGAFYSNHRKKCAVGSGILLAALALTKAVYVYWIYLLCVLAIYTWIFRRRIDNTIIITFILILTPAFIGVGGWMARNDYYLNRFTVTDRATSVVAIRTNYTKISWEQYRSGYLYFMPYFGPEIAKKYFGDIPENTFDDNKPGWEHKHMLPVFPPNWQSLSDAEMLYHFGQIMVHNSDKHIALIPLLMFRGMFVGQCCTAEGNYISDYPSLPSPIHLLMQAQKLITALLGPIFFIFIVLIIKKKNWELLLFFSPVLFNFLVHSMFTQFYTRFTIPVYPSMLVAFIVFFGFYHHKKL